MVVREGELEIVEEPRQVEQREQFAEPEPVPATFAELERRLAERARRRQQGQ
jgi:hypothetical protein